MSLPAALAPIPENPTLEVRGAARRRGDRQVLAGVDLHVARGEILALLGPNGAGKTSLVRAISGRLRLDAGQVTAPPRGRLGIVPQEVALYPDLTVRENLEVFGRLAGLAPTTVAEAVRAALEWTGLGERAGHRVGTLSGGMQRRVNLAAGALHAPELLLLDEPTVGIDPPARERIHEMLRELRARGTAILLATHDLDQAAELADRVAILVEGRVQAEGTVAALVASAFGAKRQLVVRLATPPDAVARRRLEAEGLVAGDDGLSWQGSLDGGFDTLAALGRRLSQAGIAAAEIRVREPGLRGVFFHAAGREFDA